jgi:hypothetical protein
MKHIFVFTVLFAFLVGAFAPAAFAFECDMLEKQMTSDISDEKMPCHDDSDNEQNKPHCEGLCLCLHLCINQNQVLQTFSYVFPPISHEKYILYESNAHSTAPLPLYRPPISLA